MSPPHGPVDGTRTCPTHARVAKLDTDRARAAPPAGRLASGHDRVMRDVSRGSASRRIAESKRQRGRGRADHRLPGSAHRAKTARRFEHLPDGQLAACGLGPGANDAVGAVADRMPVTVGARLKLLLLHENGTPTHGFRQLAGGWLRL